MTFRNLEVKNSLELEYSNFLFKNSFFIKSDQFYYKRNSLLFFNDYDWMSENNIRSISTINNEEILQAKHDVYSNIGLISTQVTQEYIFSKTESWMIVQEPHEKYQYNTFLKVFSLISVQKVHHGINLITLFENTTFSMKVKKSFNCFDSYFYTSNALTQIQFNINVFPVSDEVIDQRTKILNFDTENDLEKALKQNPLRYLNNKSDAYTIGELTFLTRSSSASQRFIGLKLLGDLFKNAKKGFLMDQKLFDLYYGNNDRINLLWSDLWYILIDRGDIAILARTALDDDLKIACAGIRLLKLMIGPNLYDFDVAEITTCIYINSQHIDQCFAKRSLSVDIWTKYINRSLFKRSLRSNIVDYRRFPKGPCTTSTSEITKNCIFDQELFAEDLLTGLLKTAILKRFGILINMIPNLQINSKNYVEYILCVLYHIICAGKLAVLMFIKEDVLVLFIRKVFRYKELACFTTKVAKLMNGILVQSTKAIGIMLVLNVVKSMNKAFIPVDFGCDNYNIEKIQMNTPSSSKYHRVMRGFVSKCIQISTFYDMYVNLENPFETINRRKISWFVKFISLKDNLKCYIETLTVFKSFVSINSHLNNHYLLWKYSSILLTQALTITDKIDYIIVVTYLNTFLLSFIYLICIVNTVIDLKSIRSYISIFTLLFDPSGRYRLISRFFDVWETLLLGKDLLNSLISGISLSSVIGSILQTLRMLGCKNRKIMKLQMSMSTYVYHIVVPRLLDHYQSFDVCTRKINGKLSTYLSGDLVRLTPNETYFAHLWYTTVVNPLKLALAILSENNLNMSSLGKLNSWIYTHVKLWKTQTPGSEYQPVHALRDLIGTIGLIRLFIGNREEISNFYEGSAKTAILIKHFPTSNRTYTSSNYLCSSIYWSRKLSEDLLFPWLIRKPLKFKRKIQKKVKIFMKTSIIISEHYRFNNNKKKRTFVTISRFPIPENWLLLENSFFTTEAKYDVLNISKKKTCKATIYDKWTKRGTRILLLYILTWLHIQNNKNHNQLFSLQFSRIYAFDEDKKYDFEYENVRVCGAILTWRHLEYGSLCFIKLTFDQISAKIFDRYITPFTEANFFGLHLMLLLSRSASLTLRVDIWKYITTSRVLNLVPREELLPNILKHIYTKDLEYTENLLNFRVSIVCCSLIDKEISHFSTTKNSIVIVYTISVIRSLLFRSRWRNLSASNYKTFISYADLELLPRYRNITKQYSSGLWKLIVRARTS